MTQAASQFFDQGDTHTFSDWLVTSLWRVGVDNPDELYVGVLPDVTAIVERDGRRRALAHWDKIDELNSRQLSPVGQTIKQMIAGHHFVDLAAGKMHFSVLPRLVAESFGATQYTGVDICYGGDASITNEFKHNGFKAEFVKSDIVDYLKGFQKKAPVTLYIAGLETQTPEGDVAKQDILDLLEQRTGPGDFVIVGPGTTDFDLTTRKFKKVANDQYHFAFKRRHDGIFGPVLDLLR